MANLTESGQKTSQNALSSITPQIIAQILQSLTGATSGGAAIAGQMGAINPTMGQLPEAMMKGANKALSKLGEQYAVEAAQTPEGLSNMTQMLNQPKITMAEQQMTEPQLSQGMASQGANNPELRQPSAIPPQALPGMTSIPTSNTTQQGIQPNIGEMLKTLMSFIATPGKSEGGIYKPGTSFGGLIQESNANALAGQQAASLQQEALGQKPLQVGEREKANLELQKELKKNEFTVALEDYKQNRLDEREKLKSSLKDSGEDKKSIELTKNSALDLIDLRSKVPLKGPGFGQLGDIASFFGAGTEGRAEFDSAVNQFVFDVGNVLGQKGRAFTEKEQKLVREKVVQASLSAKESDFNGRMKAIFRRINSMAGEEVLTDKDLKPRKLLKPKTSEQSTSSTPSVGEMFNGEKVLSVKRIG